MSEQKTEPQLAGKLADLQPGEVKQVRIGRLTLAVYNIDGSWYATDDTCTHALASLSEGYVDGDVVECPLHQGCFHIPTGKAMGAPVTQDIRTYPVELRGDEVYVYVPLD